MANLFDLTVHWAGVYADVNLPESLARTLKFNAKESHTTRTKQVRVTGSWQSDADAMVAKLLARNWVDATATILSEMTADRKIGTHISFADRLKTAVWRTRYNTEVTQVGFVVGNYLPDILLKSLPWFLTSGVRVTIAHFSGRVITLTPTNSRNSWRSAGSKVARTTLEQNGLPKAYHALRLLKAWVEDLRYNSEALEEIHAWNAQVIECAEALGYTHTAKGILTASQQIRAQLPPLEQIMQTVEELGPLYDIEMPHQFMMRQQEEFKSFYVNPAGNVERNHYPNRTVWAPHPRWIPAEDYSELYLAYLTIRWYLVHKIKPTYLWAFDAPPASYEAHTSYDADTDEDSYYTPRKRGADEVRAVRYTPLECMRLGLRGRMHLV